MTDISKVLRPQGSRTSDQMEQSARSGRQNIAEGSQTSATSSKGEMFLTGVARANTLICLIHQANYLLDRQLKALDKKFIEEGGFTENLYKGRQAYRKNK